MVPDIHTSVKLLNDLSYMSRICKKQANAEGGCHRCALNPFCESFNGGTKLLSQAVKESLGKLERNLIE